MHFARCLQDALCKMHLARCTLQDALCKMHFARCTFQDALCKMHCVRCTVQDALCKMHFAVCVSCHSSGSLEGGHPSSAEVIEDTEDFVYYSGFYSVFAVPKDLLYMFQRFLK